MEPKILIERSELRDHFNPEPETQATFPTIPGVHETDWTCKSCGKVYSALTLNSILWTTGYCFPCSEKVVAEMIEGELKEKNSRRKDKFKKLCPKIYHDFDKEKLPRKDVYIDILGSEFKTRGLILFADSRMGKTRIAWQLLKRIYLIEGFEFEAITELHFAHRVSEFGRSETLKDWIDKLCNVKFLFIDDLGKAVMTERVSAELFYIFEERMSNNRPIIITMQINPEAYATKISNRSGNEMADAILNRLKTHCEIIQF